MKLFSLLEGTVAARLEILTEELKQSKQTTGVNEWYLEAGKAIEEISNKYPCDYEDAAIIYEEFAKGLLLECRPSKELLREYAKHYANPTLYRVWAANRKF